MVFWGCSVSYASPWFVSGSTGLIFCECWCGDRFFVFDVHYFRWSTEMIGNYPFWCNCFSVRGSPNKRFYFWVGVREFQNYKIKFLFLCFFCSIVFGAIILLSRFLSVYFGSVMKKVFEKKLWKINFLVFLRFLVFNHKI